MPLSRSSEAEVTDPYAAIADLLACPCPKHGRLVRSAEGLRSECCNQLYKFDSGVLVLLPPLGG